VTKLLAWAGIAALLAAACATADEAGCPPTPQWFQDLTRVAYTDLPNISWSGDWPVRMLDDMSTAGVQMFISRCHSGDGWQGLGWKSQYGDLDPRLKGNAVDWEVVGGALTDADAHTGRHCLRLVHDGTRAQTYLNRRWQMNGGQQGAMLDRLKGEISYWYKAVSAKDASLWLGAIPMSAAPRETAPRTGVMIPAEQVGDGKWHHVTIPYDYTGNAQVKWIHTSCFIRGQAAELLLDDLEYVGAGPQPITNGSFEETTAERDGTREVTELCHQRHMRYVPYYWSQREPASVGQEHPEWRCLSSAGKPTVYYCVNNPDYQALVRNRCVELVRDVGVDGIFFDMLHARADECYCDACRAKFRALTGEDPPTKEDFDSLLWQQWVNLKYRSLEQSMLDINRAIKAVNPQAILLVNSWNAWAYRNSHNTRNSIRMAESVDGLLEETGWYDVADASFFAFPARHNFMNWHLAGLCRDTRALMWGACSVPGWAPAPPLEVRARVMTMMTNGAVPAHSVPGRDTMKTYMAEIAAREPYVRNARLAPWCGLVMSEKTELWYGRDDPKGRYVKGVYGAFQALLERHLPVSLVTDRDLERGRLEPYRVLFLPNCAAMSAAELQALRQFVKAGGGLVATYETSRYDEHGRRQEAFGLADLLGAKPVGDFDNQAMRPSWSPTTVRQAYLTFPEGNRFSDDPVIRETLALTGVTQAVGTIARRLPLHCRLLLAQTGQDTPGLRLTTSATDQATGSVVTTDSPGLIETTYGKGKVIYLPFDISWSFFRYGHEYLGRLMELALREVAAAPPPVEVQAPTIVQATTQLQGERVVVHLLNDMSSTGRSQNVAGESLYTRREIIPIHDISVTFRDKRLHEFRLVPGNEALRPTAGPEGITVRVPRLDLHCMVVAEP